MTFGQYVAAERKRLGLSQKDLATQLKKEDGTTISPQYLNDIERDRRGAPSDFLIEQLARLLDHENPDYLFFLAGQINPSFRDGNPPKEVVEEALVAFRSALGNPHLR